MNPNVNESISTALSSIQVDSYQHYNVELLEVKKLLATEFHDVERAYKLSAKILSSGIWTTPILVESSSGAIMDGHHRRAVALMLDLDIVPVVKLSYDDPRVTLSAWRFEDSYCPQDIIDAALSETLFPIKSTRHDLAIPLPRISVPLNKLGKIRNRF